MIYLRKDGTLHASARPRMLRRSLAMFCLLLGAAGCVLPIIPGLPFLIVAARLLGPRDQMVRRVNLLGHRSLRGMRASRLPLLRRAAARLAPHWRLFSRLMTGAR